MVNAEILHVTVMRLGSFETFEFFVLFWTHADIRARTHSLPADNELQRLV